VQFATEDASRIDPDLGTIARRLDLTAAPGAIRAGSEWNFESW